MISWGAGMKGKIKTLSTVVVGQMEKGWREEVGLVTGI